MIMAIRDHHIERNCLNLIKCQFLSINIQLILLKFNLKLHFLGICFEFEFTKRDEKQEQKQLLRTLMNIHDKLLLLLDACHMRNTC